MLCPILNIVNIGHVGHQSSVPAVHDMPKKSSKKFDKKVTGRSFDPLYIRRVFLCVQKPRGKVIYFHIITIIVIAIAAMD